MMKNDSLNRSAAGFTAQFGRAPRWIASAPGRVNLIGEFTDYNDGFVLPMALEHRTVVAGAPNDSDRITVRSEATREEVAIDLRAPLESEPRGRWSNYVRGVLAGFLHEGTMVCGFDAFVASDVPIGAGLSSSAALEVAFATLLEGLHKTKLDPLAKALLCQRAEHTFAGVPCGIMDPFIASLGQRDHVLLLDCRSRQAIWLPFADPAVSILIINTNVKHQLAIGAYSARRDDCRTAAALLEVSSLRDASLERLEQHLPCMDEAIVRRAHHVITEIARTVQAAECIREQDWIEFGQLMDASHNSLKNDYEVSCKELDIVVQVAQAIATRGGVFGCRMTGGGFGGCAVALIETARRDEIVKRMDAEYRARTNITPTFFMSRPGAGAALIEL
jgi:galactokinase